MLTISWEIPFTILNSFKTQIYDENHIDMKIDKQKTHNIFVISSLQINWLFWSHLISIFQQKSIFSLHKVFPLRIFSEKFIVSFTGMFLFGRFCNSFSRERAPFWNNFGSTIYYNFSFKNSCDTKLIQSGNEKRREKERKKFTNSYELQKIKGEMILQLGSLGKFQVNSLMTRNFLTH